MCSPGVLKLAVELDQCTVCYITDITIDDKCESHKVYKTYHM